MKVAVIGAGAAGLSAASDLAKAGYDVDVYESEAEVGGLAAGFRDETWDWYVEKFYHHWFSNDYEILNFLSELDLSDKLYFSAPTTSYYDEKGTFALDKPVFKSPLLSRIANVLSIPGLPLFARLRFGLVAAILTMIPDGTFLEKHTANEWMRRYTGKHAYEYLWRPMLIGKFGPYYDRVNMAWMWARLYKRTANLGTYEGGFQAALNDIAAKVRQQGVRIHLNTRISRIAANPDGGLNVHIRDEPEHYDAVLATFGPGLLAKMTPDLPQAYLENLKSLKGIGAYCVVLSLKRQLMTDGTYWLNLPAADPDDLYNNPLPFLALVEHTNWMNPEHFNGEHIIYLGDYLDASHEHMTMPEDDLYKRLLPYLTKVNPDFSEEWVNRYWIFRSPYAQPVPLVNHSRSIPDMRTPLKGLYFASMAQVYPWDRGTNYAVEFGRKAARMIVEDQIAT